jgi:uncharacterized protein YkwD
MAERGYVGEVTPEGETAGTRLRLAGYRTSAAAEVVVKDPSPASVVATVLRAECTRLSDPRWVAVGVGKFQDLWTMDLAGNRDP